MQNAVHLSDLDFVAVNEDNQITSMWMVVSSGNYSRDNELGRSYGAACLDFMQRTDNPSILGHIVRDMIKGGQYQGIEIGFMYIVGAYVTHLAKINEVSAQLVA